MPVLIGAGADGHPFAVGVGELHVHEIEGLAAFLANDLAGNHAVGQRRRRHHAEQQGIQYLSSHCLSCDRGLLSLLSVITDPYIHARFNLDGHFLRTWLLRLYVDY